MKRPDRLALQNAGFLVASVAAFLWMTNYIPEPARLHLPHAAYRAQVDAFFAGRLSIQDVPYHHGTDALWGRGIHQIWGLGVPFLQFLASIPGRWMGLGPYFPDHLLFLALFAFTVYGLLRLVDRIGAVRGPMSHGFPSLEKTFLLSLSVVGMPFIGLVTVRDLPYEAAPAYAILFVFITLFALLRGALTETDRALRFLAAFTAGYVCVVKVSYVGYGLTAFLALQWLVRRATMRERVLLTAVSAIGPVALLATNFLRFGNALEFGYTLNLSAIPQNDLALRFGYPFQTEPLGRAFIELGSAMFGEPAMNGYDFFRRAFFEGQSSTFRFRELYFVTYNEFYLVLLAIGIVTPAIAGRRRFFADPILWIPYLYGWSNIAFLTVFYLRAPTIASRYFLDFYPAIFSVIWTVPGSFAARIPADSASGRRIGIFATFAVGLILWVVNLDRMDYYDEHHQPLDASEVASDGVRRMTSGPALPLAYACNVGDVYDISSNRAGWSEHLHLKEVNYATTQIKDRKPRLYAAPLEPCQVEVETSIFFSSLGCIDLEYERIAGQAFDPTEIAVRADTAAMERLPDEKTTDGHEVARFCRRAAPPPFLARPNYQLLTVKWVSTHGDYYVAPPVRLLAVRNHPAGSEPSKGFGYGRTD